MGAAAYLEGRNAPGDPTVGQARPDPVGPPRLPPQYWSEGLWLRGELGLLPSGSVGGWEMSQARSWCPRLS